MATEVTGDVDWTLRFLLAAFAGVIGILVHKVVKFVQKYRYFRSMPSMEYSPLFGNMHLVPQDAEGQNKVLLNMMLKNPKFSVFWLTPLHPHVFVYHPDTMRAIFKDPGTLKPRGPRQSLEFGTPWVGEGLSLLNGERWIRTRKRVNPAFHATVLKTYLDIYNASAEKLFIKLDQYAETGEYFDIFPLMTSVLLETMMKCILGLEEDLEEFENEHHPYAEAIITLSDIWLQRFWNAALWTDTIFNLTPLSKEFKKACDYIHGVSRQILNKRKEKLERVGKPKSKHMDLIDLLLCSEDDQGNPMSEEERMSHVNTFLFAAHDTTATGLGMNIYNLAKNKEYQKKVQDEIDSFMDDRDSQKVQWDDLPKLKTMALCSKENMRMFAPIPMIPRTSNQEVVIDGHTMPPGTIFLLSINLLHTNPAVWENPEEFKPERFLADDHDTYSYLPFSSGPRTCIGQTFSTHEERVLLSRIFRRYNFDVAPFYKGPIKRMAAVMKPENGIWVKVSKRDHSKK